ncbi:MAG: LysR family transcriptional regulator [Rhodospirillales bacterium]|nr:LysR family transcriptional regulator [Rhodospirillales bacterium]
MDTEDLVLFVRTAELGSLSGAGRDMRMSPAVVSSRIQRLENQLGLRLLNRTTRQVNLTPDGETFFEHCLKILEQVDAAEEAVSTRRDKPGGALKVSAPNAFARLHIAPVIPRFLEKHPNIQFQLVASDRFVNFADEKIDIAIRVGELRDSSLIVRRLARNVRVLCASPAYLDKAPALNQPADLASHNCLLLRFPGSQQFQWTLQTPTGSTTTPATTGTMDSDNGEVLTSWCLDHHGIALKSLWEVGTYLKNGDLRVVLADYPPVAHTIHALYPHAQFLPPRVRTFIDFMLETIGDSPYWETGLDAYMPSD